MSTTSVGPRGGRRRRRWWLWALAAIVVPALLFAALPWIISSSWARPRLLAEANRILAPGAVSFEAIRVSWFKPTEIDAPALLDKKGRRLVTAPSGTFSWNLWRMLFARPVVGALALHGGAVDIRRAADGKVDLLETLEPILQDKAEHTIRIRIDAATLKFAQEGIADPFDADLADIAIDLTRHPEPIAWNLKLARKRGGGEPGRMTIVGDIGKDERGKPAMRDAALAVTGENWPWRIEPTSGEAKGIRASGLFTGALGLKVVAGALTTSGEATLAGFTAEGPKLSGDVIAQDSVKLDWKAEGRDDVYRIERFVLDAPLASASVVGEFPPAADRPAKLEGRIDLTLANLLRHTLHLRDDVAIEKGAVTLSAEATARDAAAGPGQRIEIKAALADLAAKKGETTIAWNDPTDLALALDRSPDSIALERLEVHTPFLTASGHGDLDSGIVVDAAFDLAAARAKVRDWVDLGGFDAAGAGTLQARYSRKDDQYRFDGDGGVKGLVLSGLPVVGAFRREEVKAEASVRGRAEASGLPVGWRSASLAATSAQDELRLEASSPIDRLTPESVATTARTVLDLGGAKRRFEAAAHVTVAPEAIDANDLRLAVGHAEPVGGAPAADAYVWRGSAHYDWPGDELRIARGVAALDAPERAPAVSIDDVLAGGLRSGGSTWFRVRASGDLDSIRDAYGLDELPVGGALAVECDGRQSGDSWKLDASAQGRELTLVEKDGSRTDLGAVALALDSKLGVPDRRLDVASLRLDTPFGTVEGAGTLAAAEGDATVDMKGMLTPDWDRLTLELASRVEPGASIRGVPRAWRLAGRVPLEQGGLARATLDGEAGLQIGLLDVFGMRLEKTELALRARDGGVEIEPIDGLLNGGRLRLDPAIETDEEGGRWLTLGRGSSLAGAIVNDEVSHRFLSFVAPVLDRATRVEGKVSFALADARFDLGGDSRKTKVLGDVQFDDVRFLPGPLVIQLFGVFNLQQRAILVLRDPVSIRILGRTVYQQGLILPVGDVAVIGLEGWIDFDKRIDMLATFAAVPPAREVPVLSTLLRAAQLQLPLTGTLDNPKIDGARIGRQFQELGASILDSTLGIGDLVRPRPVAPRLPAPPAEAAPPVKDRERAAPERDVPIPPAPGLDSDAEAEAEPEAESKAGSDSGAGLDGLLDFIPNLVGPPKTAEERQLQKEARQQRQREKRNERRARRGLPPL